MENETSYFKKHWRGELDLGVSYWINNVLLSVLIILIGMILGTIASLEIVSLTATLIFVILFYLFIFFIYVPWAYIGLWRSASNHIKKHGLFFWANVVRVLIAIGIFQISTAFIYNIYPQMVGYVKLLIGANDIPNYKLSLDENHTTLNITGGIKLGLTKDVTSYIESYPSIKSIHIESLGGIAGEAIGVAKIIQKKHLDTYVSGDCMSACTYIFISGKERVVNIHAQLGFHRPSIDGVKDSKIDIREDRRLFERKGVDSAFINRIFSTPNLEILQPSLKELEEVGIVTKIENSLRYFWEKSEEELALLLESSGIKKRTLEKNVTQLMNIVYRNRDDSLPAKIDRSTILNSVTIKDNFLKYRYSVLKNSNVEDLNEFQKKMGKDIKIGVCNDILSVYLLKRGVIIQHDYRDELKNSLLANIEIMDCSK